MNDNSTPFLIMARESREVFFSHLKTVLRALERRHALDMGETEEEQRDEFQKSIKSQRPAKV